MAELQPATETPEQHQARLAAEAAERAQNVAANRASRPNLTPLDRVAESLEWLASEMRAERLARSLTTTAEVEQQPYRVLRRRRYTVVTDLTAAELGLDVHSHVFEHDGWAYHELAYVCWEVPA